MAQRALESVAYLRYLSRYRTLGKVGYYGKNDQLQEETMQWKELGVAAPVTMIHAQRKYRN